MGSNSVDSSKCVASFADSRQRWLHLSKFLERSGPFSHPEFVPSSQNIEFIHRCKLLVVGAGGLGCELLKNLALMGFQNIHVIDMDTIDISNLNRQFLFRMEDVGKPKAEVAAKFIQARIPGCSVTPHFCRIQDKPADFYQSFSIVISGLDSVSARRWINGMLVGLLHYDENGELDTSSVIPLIDGGTEGFKGNVRVILPGLTPCIECTLSLYPPQVNYPMCTIAHTPRSPEHCVEYVRMILWSKMQPFGNCDIDGDNPDHINWIYGKAVERAQAYSIQGVTYRLTQGVIKNIIPAVASTNAVIAAACSLEAFKIASSSALPLNNYMNFQDSDGVYTGVVELQKKEDCLVCSQKPQKITFAEDAKLEDIVTFLVNSAEYQMKSPSLTALTPKFTTLYMPTVPSLEQQTKKNLEKSIKELGLHDGQEIYVADQTTPMTITFMLHLTSPMEVSRSP